MTLGIVLKKIRRTKQISQKEIIQALQTSKSTIYRFEKGGSIETDIYLKYCNYLGVDAGLPYLISEHEDLYQVFNQIAHNPYDYELFEMAFYSALLKTTKQAIQKFSK